MEKQVKIIIKGKVQGIGFRFTAHLGYVDLGLIGSAENLKDGSVQLIVKGEPDKIERLVKWCHKGPEGARVESVDVEEMPVDPDLGDIEKKK